MQWDTTEILMETHWFHIGHVQTSLHKTSEYSNKASSITAMRNQLGPV